MRRLTIILVTIFLMTGCAALQKNDRLDVALKLKREKLDRASVLVFNFKEPVHAAGAGAHTAERFHINLLKSKKFKVVSLYANSPWIRIGETEEERLINAIEEGRSQQFDYILVGELKEYFYGGINKTRVRIKIRIIELKSRTTIFLAEDNLSNIGKDPSYPMDTKLTKRSADPKMIAERLVKELIDRI